jgi:hypothetical protein
MNKLKSIFNRMFESSWAYSHDCNVRTHKDTGKVEYLWFDDWGHWYDSVPMFTKDLV